MAGRRRVGRQKKKSKPPKKQQETFLQDVPNELLRIITGYVAGWRPGHGLQALSLVNKRFRVLSFPALFSSVHIVEYEDTVGDELNQLMASTQILCAIRTLDIDQSFYLHYLSDPFISSSPIGELLLAMPNLAELTVSSAIFGLAWAVQSAVCLPAVKVLGLLLHGREAIGDTYVLSRIFPNLEILSLPGSLESEHGFDENRRFNLPHLKTLRYDHPPKSTFQWDATYVSRWHRAAPNVEFLLVRGELNDLRVSDLLPSFAKFKSLKRLAIATHQYIGRHALALYRIYLSGVPSDEEDEDPNKEHMFRKFKLDDLFNEDPHEMAEAYFEAITSLEEICLAAYGTSEVFTVVRDENGKVERVEQTNKTNKVRPGAGTYDQYWEKQSWTRLPAIMTADQLKN